MADLGSGDLRPADGGGEQPDGTRGCLHLIEEQLGEELIEALVDDISAGIDLRLSFEAWADSR